MRALLLLAVAALWTTPSAPAQHIDSLVVRLQRTAATGDAQATVTAADAILRRRGPDANDQPTVFALVAKAGALSEMGRDALALPVASRAVRVAPYVPHVWSLRAQVYDALGEPGKAADDLAIGAEWADGDPDLAFGFRRMGAFYLSQAGRLGEADSLQTALLTLDALTPERRSDLFSGRGETRYRAGDLEGAFADFEAALEALPDSPLALLSRVDVLLRESRFDEARVDLDRTLALDPETIPAYLHGIAFVNRGYVRRLGGEAAAASEDVAAGLERFPENPLAYRLRALLHLDGGDVPAACADLQQALLLDYYGKFGPYYQYGPDVRELLAEHCSVEP